MSDYVTKIEVSNSNFPDLGLSAFLTSNGPTTGLTSLDHSYNLFWSMLNNIFYRCLGDESDAIHPKILVQLSLSPQSKITENQKLSTSVDPTLSAPDKPHHVIKSNTR